MKILIAAFLCISVPAVSTIGSNSSQFESKIIDGDDLKNPLSVQYLVTIYYSDNEIGNTFIVAMGSAYTEYCVITSKDKAMKIEENKAKYILVVSEYFFCNRYGIEDALYVQPMTALDSVTSTQFGLLRVSGQMSLGLQNPISLIDMHNHGDFLSGTNFYTAGWSITEYSAVLKYAQVYMMKNEVCSRMIRFAFNFPAELNLICATSSQIFEEHDLGAPVYLQNDFLAGIISHYIFRGEQQIIFISLLHHRKRNIDHLAKESPDDCQYEGLALPDFSSLSIRTRTEPSESPEMLMNCPVELNSFQNAMYDFREMDTQNPMQPYVETYQLPSINRGPEYGRNTVSFRSNLPQEPSTARPFLSSSFRSSMRDSAEPVQPSTAGGRRRHLIPRSDYDEHDSSSRNYGRTTIASSARYSEEPDSQPSAVGRRRDTRRRNPSSSSSIPHISTSIRSDTNEELGGVSRAEGRRSSRRNTQPHDDPDLLSSIPRDHRMSSLRTSRRLIQEPDEQPSATGSQQERSFQNDDSEHAPAPSRSKWRSMSFRRH